MLKRLWNLEDQFNKKGIEFSKEISGLLAPIIDKWTKAGYSTADMRSICYGDIAYICSMANITKRIEE